MFKVHEIQFVSKLIQFCQKWQLVFKTVGCIQKHLIGTDSFRFAKSYNYYKRARIIIRVRRKQPTLQVHLEKLCALPNWINLLQLTTRSLIYLQT